MSFSDYLETKVLKENFTNAIGLYVALFTTDPTDANTATEFTGNTYVRQSISFGTPTDDGAGSMQIVNSAEVRFPVATADWGTIAYAGIYDAQTGGNLLDHSAFDVSKSILTNDQFVIDAGGYAIKLD